jgi:hypothetical protein
MAAYRVVLSIRKRFERICRTHEVYKHSVHVTSFVVMRRLRSIVFAWTG